MLLIIPAFAFTEPSGTVKVTVTNIDDVKGTLRIGLYNDPSNFPKKNSYKGTVVKVTGKTVTFKFTGLPAGKYAIALLHDENGNGKMDFNFMKIPQEGYSFSNNAIPKFREPSFEEAAFFVGDKEIQQVLKVNYW